MNKEIIAIQILAICMQTKERELMKIENYLNTEEFKTRRQLVDVTGMTDRAVRQAISNLKKTRAVIYNSQTRRVQISERHKKI